MSPIAEFIYTNTGIDPFYIIVLLLILFIVLLIIYISTASKMKKLTKKLEKFMQGRERQSIEDTLYNCLDKIDILDEKIRVTTDELVGLRRTQRISYQKMGMVRYDAFFDLSGKLSYAICLLDQDENGFLLNSVYAREGSYSYLKRIVAGKSSIELSGEEQKALEKALGRELSDDADA